jgi:site-specific DNA recombinase
MMRTRVVGYARVSTDRQADKGVSLESQREKIAAYAALYDLELVDIVVESASAKSLDREGLQLALSSLREGRADALLVVKLDRLTRSVRDLGSLVEGYFIGGKSDLLSVTDHIDTRTASGRMVLNVLVTMFQWERESACERTRDALQLKKKRGDRLGRPRFGWYVVSRTDPNNADASIKVLVENPEEQAVITKARALRAEGQTQAQIAVVLSIHATQVSRILRAA